jgi:hypothetical protein
MTTTRRPRGRRIATAFVVAVLVFVFVACAGPDETAPPPEGGDGTGGIDELLVSCGGTGFPPAALRGPVGAEGLDDPAAEALRALLNERGPDAAMLPDAGWRLVLRDGVSATFIADSEAGEAGIAAGEPPLWAVSVSVGGGRWYADGWGQCNPQVLLGGGVHPGRWGLDPAKPPPGPDATRLAVIVEEIGCADGPPGDRVMTPIVDYGPDAITILARLRDLPPGTYPCPGLPGTPAGFELTEPIGERALLDGVNFPPRPPALLFRPP